MSRHALLGAHACRGFWSRSFRSYTLTKSGYIVLCQPLATELCHCCHMFAPICSSRTSVTGGSDSFPVLDLGLQAADSQTVSTCLIRWLLRWSDSLNLLPQAWSQAQFLTWVLIGYHSALLTENFSVKSCVLYPFATLLHQLAVPFLPASLLYPDGRSALSSI